MAYNAGPEHGMPHGKQVLAQTYLGERKREED